MWPYIALGALLAFPAAIRTGRSHFPTIGFAFFLILVLFVGLRHNVGMDWNNYLLMIVRAARAHNLESLWRVSEPLYGLLLKLGYNSGFGIYATNFLAALIFFGGIFSFVRRTPEPFLGLLVALPILIVVVGMSANRQAAAIGVTLWLTANWSRLGLRKRALGVGIAATFHASALLFLVFLLDELRINRTFKLFGLVLITLATFLILDASGRTTYYDNLYVSGQTALTRSPGALYHVALNAVPASLFFFMPKYRDLLFPTEMLRIMAVFALVCLPLALFASAAAGRISLYWFPVSIWVLSALPSVLAPRAQQLVRVGICTTMLALLVGWLAFANSSSAHIPYRNALFMPWHELDIVGRR